MSPLKNKPIISRPGDLSRNQPQSNPDKPELKIED